MQHSTGRMTKEEAAWVHAIKHAGCILCMRRGYFREEGGPLAEAHHLLSGGIRRGHLFSIGLCPWHHRGRLIVEGWDFRMHRIKLGPSLAEGSDPFEEEWGTDDELLQRQREIVQRNARRF